MNHGLSDDTVKKICGVFEKYPQIQKAILYGSRAKGNYKTGSDIDITLLGEGLSQQLCMDVADALDELLLAYMIDLSIFDSLNHAELKAHIDRVGIALYTAEPKV
jgi:uncharacterized protein